MLRNTRPSPRVAAVLSFSVALAVVFALAACDTGGPEEPRPQPIDFSKFSKDSTLVEGRWAWQRSTGYFTPSGEPHTQMPASTDSTETLVFTEHAAPKRVTLETYQNGDLKEQATYPTWQRLYEAEYDNFLFGVREDTLAISAAPRDGLERVYTRVDK